MSPGRIAPRACKTEPSRTVQDLLCEAAMRWWRRHGRRWGLARQLMAHRGWTEEDLAQQVCLIVLARQQGKSAYDATRSTMDAYVGLVGRSALLHEWERRAAQPAVGEDLGLTSHRVDLPPVLEGASTRPDDERPTVEEARLALGLSVSAPVWRGQLRRDAEAKLEEQAFTGDGEQLLLFAGLDHRGGA